MAYVQPMTDPTSVMGRRIGAYLLDGLIGLVLVTAMIFPLARSNVETRTFSNAAAANEYCTQINDATLGSDGSGVSNESDRISGQISPITQGICVPSGTHAYFYSGSALNSLVDQLQLIGLLTIALNFVVLQGLTGASLGKHITGLRVVGKNGRRVSFGWNVLRTLFLVVDSFFFAIVGLITAFSSKGHRRVGDMVASTFVVHKSSVDTHLEIPGLTSPPPEGSWPQGTGQPGYPQQGWANPPMAGQPKAWGPTDTTAPGTSPTPGTDGPTWDHARNTYIQYDREVGAWVQWDDNVKSWRPIDH